MTSIQLRTSKVDSDNGNIGFVPLQHVVIDDELPITLRGFIDEREFSEQVREVNELLAKEMDAVFAELKRFTNITWAMIPVALCTAGVGVFCMMPFMISRMNRAIKRAKAAEAAVRDYFKEVRASKKWTSRGIDWCMRVDEVGRVGAEGRTCSITVFTVELAPGLQPRHTNEHGAAVSYTKAAAIESADRHPSATYTSNGAAQRHGSSYTPMLQNVSVAPTMGHPRAYVAGRDAQPLYAPVYCSSCGALLLAPGDCSACGKVAAR